MEWIKGTLVVVGLPREATARCFWYTVFPALCDLFWLNWKDRTSMTQTALSVAVLRSSFLLYYSTRDIRAMCKDYWIITDHLLKVIITNIITDSPLQYTQLFCQPVTLDFCGMSLPTLIVCRFWSLSPLPRATVPLLWLAGWETNAVWQWVRVPLLS